MLKPANKNFIDVQFQGNTIDSMAGSYRVAEPQIFNIDDVTRRYTYDPIYKKSFKESVREFPEKYSTQIRSVKIILFNIAIVGYFAWATFYYFQQSLLLC